MDAIVTKLVSRFALGGLQREAEILASRDRHDTCSFDALRWREFSIRW